MTFSLSLARSVLAVMFLVPALAVAQELPMPEGDVVLTVDGAIGITNEGDTARFDREMLAALDPVTIETSTIWTEGLQTFTGVPLVRLMEAVAADGDSMNATAINDYAVEIPRSDWVEGGPILAYLNNGAEMSVRQKGPLWVIYPFDSSPDYQTEVIYARSIWQLDRITVVD